MKTSILLSLLPTLLLSSVSAHHKSSSHRISGASYCTWSPEYDCYQNGWPSCCSDDSQDCPKQQPQCDDQPLEGASYCTFAPDDSCYEDGWPSCCSAQGNTCPRDQPGCDVPTDAPTMAPTTEAPIITGNNYCVWSADYSCYQSGWPSCCSDDPDNCPKQQPQCDVVTEAPTASPTMAPTTEAPVVSGNSYCVWSPDYSCYQSGWPSCCSDDPDDCPKQQPQCDNAPIAGASYCTFAPDYSCFENGWPSCCDAEGNTCPRDQPGCDNSGRRLRGRF